MDTLEWLRSLIIVGREKDDEDDQGGSDDDVDDDGADEGADDDDKGGEGDDDDKGEDDDKDDVEALKRALREERQARRKAERDARRATKKKAATKEDKDLNATKEQLEVERGKTTALAAKLLNQSRDAAILVEARKLGFIDETDALLDTVRAEVDFDQDDDDPSDIDIVAESVTDAVKSLADKKPHLVGKNSNGSSNQRSGSRMGKKGSADEGKLTDEKLQTLYTI
jgi:hypothetical protein